MSLALNSYPLFVSNRSINGDAYRISGYRWNPQEPEWKVVGLSSFDVGDGCHEIKYLVEAL